MGKPIRAVERAREGRTHACSYRFRPGGVLVYEHMFPSADTPPLARRFFRTLAVIRSFLLLEDDYEIDWEVDRDEPIEPPSCGSRSSTGIEVDHAKHSHRRALRSRLGERRPGAGTPREQVCLCPLPPRGDREREAGRASARFEDHDGHGTCGDCPVVVVAGVHGDETGP